MRVTLKKAAALSTALLALPTAIPTSIQLSIYSDADVEAAVKEADQSIIKAVDTVLTTVSAGYAIRKLIGEKNMGQISNLLTDRALLDKKLAVLNAVANEVNPPDYEAISRRREASRNAGENSFRHTETIQITVPTNQIVLDEIKKTKKERIGIEDRLAELNFQTTIELPDDVVAVLRDNDLI